MGKRGFFVHAESRGLYLMKVLTSADPVSVNPESP
jgi:hypothetical protein